MGWGDGGGGKGGGGKGGARGGASKITQPAKTIWLGNIPEGTTYQEVLALAREVGDAVWAEVFDAKHSAAVGFRSPETAAAAVAALNGTSIGDTELVADAWENKAPGAAGGEGGGGSKGGPCKGGGWGKGGGKPPSQPWGQPKGAWQPQFQKKGGCKGSGGWGGNKATVKYPSKAVWVGNIPEGTSYKELLDLARQIGNAKWAEVFSKGTGVIGFDSEETAESAILALNGAELGSAVLIADTYEKKKKQEETMQEEE